MWTVGLLWVVGNFAAFSHSYCGRIVEVFFGWFAFWVVVYIVVVVGRGLCVCVSSVGVVCVLIVWLFDVCVVCVIGCVGGLVDSFVKYNTLGYDDVSFWFGVGSCVV